MHAVNASAPAPGGECTARQRVPDDCDFSQHTCAPRNTASTRRASASLRFVRMIGGDSIKLSGSRPATTARRGVRPGRPRPSPRSTLIDVYGGCRQVARYRSRDRHERGRFNASVRHLASTAVNVPSRLARRILSATFQPRMTRFYIMLIIAKLGSKSTTSIFSITSCAT
jgi:hypothetical protein